jgi:hypothetical protein
MRRFNRLSKLRRNAEKMPSVAFFQLGVLHSKTPPKASYPAMPDSKTPPSVAVKRQITGGKHDQ